MQAAITEGVILGMGNPLLDITATVTTDMLEEYGLEANNAILAEEKHMPIYEKLVGMGGDYTAGGATQNSVRVAQWMLQTPGATSFFGAVGVDDFSEAMTSSARRDGVNVQYQNNPDLATGTCGVLITGKNRSSCESLGCQHVHAGSPKGTGAVERRGEGRSVLHQWVLPDSLSGVHDRGWETRLGEQQADVLQPVGPVPHRGPNLLRAYEGGTAVC